jgi:hypothetical protein
MQNSELPTRLAMHPHPTIESFYRSSYTLDLANTVRFRFPLTKPHRPTCRSAPPSSIRWQKKGLKTKLLPHLFPTTNPSPPSSSPSLESLASTGRGRAQSPAAGRSSVSRRRLYVVPAGLGTRSLPPLLVGRLCAGLSFAAVSSPPEPRTSTRDQGKHCTEQHVWAGSFAFSAAAILQGAVEVLGEKYMFSLLYFFVSLSLQYFLPWISFSLLDKIRLSCFQFDCTKKTSSSSRCAPASARSPVIFFIWLCFTRFSSNLDVAVF